MCGVVGGCPSAHWEDSQCVWGVGGCSSGHWASCRAVLPSVCGMCRVDKVISFSQISPRRGGRTKWQEGHRLDTEIEMVRDAEKPERGIQVP